MAWLVLIATGSIVVVVMLITVIGIGCSALSIVDATSEFVRRPFTTTLVWMGGLLSLISGLIVGLAFTSSRGIQWESVAAGTLGFVSGIALYFKSTAWGAAMASVVGRVADARGPRDH
ncbi:MAG: hypothetical protein CMJ31_06740 [Phycisphaerae bacterium]|nr:hypothetical protein [Phycisphaerae bacterium]